MVAPKIQEAVSCRCGGHPRLIGPSGFAPNSHWVVYCSNDACDQMSSAARLEDAIEAWNQLLIPACSWAE